MPGFQQQPASEPSRAWLYNAQNSNPRRDRPVDAVEAGGGVFLEGILPDADDFPSADFEAKKAVFFSSRACQMSRSDPTFLREMGR